MKRLLMIDCENVLNRLLESRLISLKNWEIVLVLGKNQKFDFKFIEENRNIKLIRASSRGHNACDYLLLTEMLLRLSTNKYLSIVILSEDKGYDISVKELKNTYIINRYTVEKFYLKIKYTDIDQLILGDIIKQDSIKKEETKIRKEIKHATKKIASSEKIKIKGKREKNIKTSKIIRDTFKEFTVVELNRANNLIFYLNKNYIYPIEKECFFEKMELLCGIESLNKIYENFLSKGILKEDKNCEYISYMLHNIRR